VRILSAQISAFLCIFSAQNKNQKLGNKCLYDATLKALNELKERKINNK